MRLALCALLAAAAAFGADNTAGGKPRVPRMALAAIEKDFDHRIDRAATLESLDLLGNTRAVYLDDYGVVFSTEVSLAVGRPMLPMSPALTAADIQALRARKLERVPMLKRIMREMLVTAASTLEGMPANERIVLAVSLFYQKFERRDGLPDQIVMQAPRQLLLDIKDKKAVDGEIRVGEY